MIGNLLNAGATLRTTASSMLQAARSSVGETRLKCDVADRDVHKTLSDLDVKRRLVSERLLTAYPLYRLAGLVNPGLPAPADAVRLPKLAFDEPALPTMPSASLWIVAGALAGAALGAAVCFFGGTASPVAWGAAMASSALIGLMLAGSLQGQKVFSTARQYTASAEKWQERAVSHIAQIERIGKGAALSAQLTATLGSRVQSRETELEAIALDTTNAAVLLKDVLNTALLNEDGSFLEDVVDQLHGQKKRIADFAGQIAVDA